MIDHSPENIKKIIKKIMASALNVSLNEITDELSHRSINQWKGKNHLKMIELLESEFDIKFETNERYNFFFTGYIYILSFFIHI